MFWYDDGIPPIVFGLGNCHFFFFLKVGTLLLLKRKKKGQEINILAFLAAKNLSYVYFFSVLFPLLSTEIILISWVIQK